MIYLDHAATSFPKPEAVLAAVAHWFREIGVSPARGDSALSATADRLVQDARRMLGTLCGLPAARIAFTSGATEAINLFLRGHLQPGDRVVTTATEHSSVARPLRALQAALGIETTVVPCDGAGRVDPAAVATALRVRPTRLVVFSHASNVTGAVQDGATLCALARAAGATSLVDASQTAGLVPLAPLGADALVASTHKALLAPPGLGFLAVRADVALTPHKQGGTGSSRALDTHPDEWPAAFEAGTPNTPAILGLGAALPIVQAQAADWRVQGCAHLDLLRAQLTERLGAGVRWHGPARGERVPVASFTLQSLDPAEAGIVLDAAGVHVRTGYHCAPWIHACLGTQAGGTIRVSPGPSVSATEVLAVARALAP